MEEYGIETEMIQRLNLTIVDCKLNQDIFVFCFRKRLNLTIVDCKWNYVTRYNDDNIVLISP